MTASAQAQERDCLPIARADMPWTGSVPAAGLCIAADELAIGDVVIAIEREQDVNIRDSASDCSHRDHPGYSADALRWQSGDISISAAEPHGEITLDIIGVKSGSASTASALAALCSQSDQGATLSASDSRQRAEVALRNETNQELIVRLKAMLSQLAIERGKPADAARYDQSAARQVGSSKLAYPHLGRRWLDIIQSDAYATLGNTRAATSRACEALSGEPLCNPDSVSDNALISGIAANRMGLLHHRSGALETAQRWYQSALERFANRSPGLQAITTGNLGGIASVQGRYADAIARFKTAESQLRNTGRRDSLVSTLNNLGAAHIRRGEYQAGLQTLRESLTLSESVRNDRMTMSARMLLADLLRRLGRPAEARGYIMQALASPVADTWRTGRAHVEVVNGRIATDVDDHEAASAAFERALAIYQSLDDAWSTVSSQVSLARALAANGNATAALEMASASLHSASEHGFARHRGESLLVAGIAALAGGDLDAAEAHLRAALAVANDNLDLTSAVEVNTLLANLAMQRANRGAALTYLDQAFRVADNGAAEIARADDRALFESRIQQARDLMLATLIELDRPAEALEFVIARQRLDGFTQPEQSASADALRDALARAAAAANQLADPAKAAAERQRAARLLLELRREQTGQSQDKPAMDLAAVQAALPSNGVYLHYSAAEPHSHLWVVRANAMAHRNLPGRQALIARTAALRTAIESLRPHEGLRAELSAALLPELQAGEALFVAADGALAQVPFGMLGADRYLLEDHTVVSLPHTAALRDRLQASPAGDANELSIAVFADPIFDARDSRVSEAVNRKPGLNRLPFTALEAGALAAAVPRTQVWLGGAATRDAVREVLAVAPDILHLATHGRVDNLLPEASGLFFSELTPEGEPRDGLLTLVDLYSQPIPSRLVVLSACDTAAGAPLTSEGSLSLARAFLRQGAGQVVATLWPVADHTTAALTERFYQAALTEALPVSEALRQAQLHLLRNPRTAHPFYWAGYTVAGAGQPLLAPTTR